MATSRILFRPEWLCRLLPVLLVAAATLLPAAPTVAAETDDFVVVRFPQPSPATSFSDTWGAPRSRGRRHVGTDIFAPKQTPLVAVADGVVGRIAESPRAGVHIVIDHDGGWQSWYMHLLNDTPGTDDGAGGIETGIAAGLQEGDAVVAGEVIGWVGDSGNAEGASPHTHFELHSPQRRVNPYPYLLAAWERQLRLWAIEGLVS